MRVWCLFLVAAIASPQTPEAPLTVDQRRLNLETFETVWKTVHDRHWERERIEATWARARQKALPAAKAAPTMERFRAAVRAMLAELGQSHFAIIPAEVYRRLSEPEHERPGETPEAAAERKARRLADEAARDDFVTGIEAGIVEGRATVVAVQPGSPAAAAGVRPGWWIDAVDGASTNDWFDALESTDARERQRWMAAAVESALEGRRSERASVRCTDAAGKQVSLELERVEPRGKLARLGHMPGAHVFLEASRIGDSIGYVRFNAFLDPETLMPEFEKAVRGCTGCRGFIVDLRGNPGGLGAMAMGMAGWFVRRGRQRLGTMTSLDATMHFEIYPRARTFDGPLAILIDERSASTSEIFAAGLRDLKRARLFGARTAGAALPSTFVRLPNGDGFQYAEASYVSSGGLVLEGAGVEPDVAVSHTRQALLAGRDLIVEAAADWIRSQ